ncbi:MAG: hypothetical protein ACF8LK_00425, partial [Phycisphaerales bacterium JB041]
SKFYLRTGNGKHQMDYSEIRSAFVEGGEQPERLRQWRNERIREILSPSPVIPPPDGPKCILHVVPFGFNRDRAFLGSLKSHEAVSDFPTPGMGCTHYRLNLDGFLNFTAASERGMAGPGLSYCQVFRSGAVEAVWGDIAYEESGVRVLRGAWHEQTLVNSVGTYTNRLHGLGAQFPFVVFVSLTGLKNCSLQSGRAWRHSREVVDRDLVTLPELIMEQHPDDLPLIMKETMDVLWQAGGLEGSPHFNAQGQWTGEPLSFPK